MPENRKEVLGSFGLRLRELRISKGLTQEELATLADLNRNYVNQVEAGRRNVSILNIVRIANALEVEQWELLKWD